MVVCKCRKATKLYCFVHKVPVCGECIISSEHQICVVRTYSEWVIDGDYDWPPKCSSCHETFQDGDNATIRLGCLHVFHTPCLVSYLQSFPPHTAPAGYVCPSCPAMIWPPKSIKDQSSALPSKLKEAILQSGLGKTLLGSDLTAVQQPPPPAFSSAPLVSFSALAPVTASPDAATSEIISNGDFPLATSGHEANVLLGINFPASGLGGGISSSGAVTEVDGSSTAANGPHSSLTAVSFTKTGKPATQLQPGAMTRKSSYRGEKPGSPYADNGRDDDEDGIRRKYSRRGPIHRQFLKNLLPFWSNTLPTLPVTAPARKDDRDASVAEELIEGRSRRRQRSNTVDPRKILFLFAIMSCMATMMLLYYRLSQGAASENLPQVEEQ